MEVGRVTLFAAISTTSWKAFMGRWTKTGSTMMQLDQHTKRKIIALSLTAWDTLQIQLWWMFADISNAQDHVTLLHLLWVQGLKIFITVLVRSLVCVVWYQSQQMSGFVWLVICIPRCSMEGFRGQIKWSREGGFGMICLHIGKLIIGVEVWYEVVPCMTCPTCGPSAQFAWPSLFSWIYGIKLWQQWHFHKMSSSTSLNIRHLWPTSFY